MDTKKYCLYQWRLYPRPASNGSPRKFEPKISDFVHVRPKSAKEIGYTGRVTYINANTATVTDGNSVNNDQKVSQKSLKNVARRESLQKMCVLQSNNIVTTTVPRNMKIVSHVTIRNMTSVLLD
jgi:hypothetical protein